MTLVAVVDILLYAQSLKGKHTAYTQQYLLLQSVLPVTAVKL